MEKLYPRASVCIIESLNTIACGVGFVANIKGEKSHEIVQNGIEVLENLKHRGAVGCDPNTGDGAGITTQIPHEFFLKECKRLLY